MPFASCSIPAELPKSVGAQLKPMLCAPGFCQIALHRKSKIVSRVLLHRLPERALQCSVRIIQQWPRRQGTEQQRGGNCLVSHRRGCR
jgi:hypothetical protein